MSIYDTGNSMDPRPQIAIVNETTRMRGFQSGMFSSRDQPYGLDELVPGLALS